MAVIMESIKSPNPDWASLPSDLLYLITTKLSDLLDFIGFRAVCKPWRASAPISNLPPPQFPWILDFNVSDRLRFFSLSSGKVFTFPVPPQLNGKHLLGPQLVGYLLFGRYHAKDMSLFNPLSRHHVLLPSFVDSWFPNYVLEQAGDYLIASIWRCNSSRLASYRLGDQKWNIGKERGHQLNRTCLCSNGMLFSYEWWNGGTKIVEIATDELISVVSSPLKKTQAFFSFVESFGDILMVATSNYWAIYDHFFIYKLNVDFDSANQNPYWVQTKSIGDCVLFISGHASFSFKAGQFHGSVSNCIYFQDGSSIYRYSIEDGGRVMIPCPFDNWRVFVPSLQYLNTSSSE
ncbi:hypothetical protein LUZ63_013153 [Rhynchospora breviuscula]|uniref:KIB1-4 beta-propeller domain-containing protein n=1 Tax=Rhynchospora breviuscula TaxID=2022672 RepID=A0A9Q0C829_9POAL|nr:hypothetical protein LUZ63_013153 [Rhynchospora breviuscula]